MRWRMLTSNLASVTRVLVRSSGILNSAGLTTENFRFSESGGGAAIFGLSSLMICAMEGGHLDSASDADV